MKTMMFVCLGLALASSQAAAGDLSRARSNYDALVASPEPGPERLRGSGDCGPDRASPVWGANGQPLGYECLGGANGS